ncbi:MAG: non-hydrolyzing UDP-N-acetylglucosamine 2-epimerase [Campylobacterales bacterium]
MKIVTIVGARPQFIKSATLSRHIAKYEHIDEVVIHTGQHYDVSMSDLFFKQMDISKPKYHLGVSSTSHAKMTAEMIKKIEDVLIDEKPDLVLLYGDTNSTLAGAITASKLHIKIAHIEAGLRSFDTSMPEEINRIITDRLSSYLFCPTDRAVENLKNEGFDSFDCSIIKSGDIMYDSVLYYKKFAKKPDIEISNDFIIATIHRPENSDSSENLKNIIDALNHIGKSTQVILPVHPRTKKQLQSFDIKVDFDVIEPVGYFEMLWLLENCSRVVTDSGGLQKEAYFFQKPCIVLRNSTEWTELLDIGCSVLVGQDRDRIVVACETLKFSSDATGLYGNGDASEIIIKEILK